MNSEHVFAWFVAILSGAAAPALVNAILSGPIFFDTAFLFAFIVTLAHAILLGVPAALLFRSQGWTRLPGAILGGFVIGVVPYAVTFMPRSTAEHIVSSDEWLQFWKVLAFVGCYGALGAFAFWLTLWLFGALTVTDPDRPDNPAV